MSNFQPTIAAHASGPLQIHDGGAFQTENRLQEAESAYRTLLSAEPDNADALAMLGIIAEQRGESEVALRLLRQAHALQPENPVFAGAIATILRAVGQYAEAAKMYEKAVLVETQDLFLWIGFGSVLQQLGRHADAVDCYRKILNIHQDHAPAHNDLGVALSVLKLYQDAENSLHQALLLKPDYVEALLNLGNVCKVQNRLDEALSHYQSAVDLRPGYVPAMFNIGTVYLMQKQFGAAHNYFRNILLLEPDHDAARISLAGTLTQMNLPGQAKLHWDRIYQKQPITIQRARAPVRTVVILLADGDGNVPYESLFPGEFFDRIFCMMEYVRENQMRALPAYDLVFNAIGDSDASGPTDTAVKQFRSFAGRPFLNSPEAVNNTSRERMEELFSHIAGVLCAPTIRCESRCLGNTILQTQKMHFPIVIRPEGSHGGKNFLKIDSPGALHRTDLSGSPFYYASNFLDYRSSDGYYRKYRIVFIDRRPFPYHLAISMNWIVHYCTADMRESQWKHEEELAFLENPRKVLGESAMRAIAAVGLALDLDYCGVDFTQLSDGRILVFEANATMLMHGESADSELHYKNRHVQKIFDAFHQRYLGLVS